MALEASAEAQSAGRDARFRAPWRRPWSTAWLLRGRSSIGDITVVDRVPDLRVNVDARACHPPRRSEDHPGILKRDDGFITRVPIDVLNLPSESA